MSKTILLFVMLLIFSTALPLQAAPQGQESLGDLARQLRAQHAKTSNKATKVFTNDNLPSRPREEAAAPQPPKAPSDQQPSKVAIPPSDKDKGKAPDDIAKDRDYWQGKFAAARKDLSKAKEQQQLAEDELNLLQIQQVRELDAATKQELTEKVQAKQSEVEVNQATTVAAQKALDDLEKEFKESGAPDDWSKTE